MFDKGTVMTKTKIIVEKVEKEMVTEVTCDVCQKTFKSDGDTFGLPVSRLVLHSGYGSKFDGTDLTIDICDDCLQKMLDKEKISLKSYTLAEKW
jgi:hypothetical protein